MCIRDRTEEQYYEFQANEQLLNAYKNFVGTILDPSLLGFLLASIERLNKTRTVVPSFPEPPPKPFWPKRIPVLKITELKAIEVARQLTLIESEMFKSIKPQELCEQAWMKSDKHIFAPNVTQMAHRFNKVVYYIMSTILQAKKPAKRERILSKWINIGRFCRELENYNGVMEVVAALASGPIVRLLDLKKKLNTPQALELKALMSHEQNFRTYRDALKHTNPPLLPYLGNFQTDLVFIDEGLKIKWNGLVHFYKCYRVAAVIQQVQQYQQSPYNLQNVHPINDFLMHIEPLDEDKCWELSLQIQPRGGGGSSNKGTPKKN
eukprot:TRINITY_DN7715_c0_g1_i1.p1 TRINITY_DN7715_c0_g1~~TRINITY_DN7715_c0_g1_i1.p1  ORF type:complete len:321 (+),score=53.95 TRINITY_DN7715_c0_g1_i1:37-999(+)